MALNFNGNTPKKILYNGLNVAKLVYNGVVVWMSKVLATIEGILPLNLTDCTGDDLVDYKIYGNSEYEGLPDGYTQVEYLESTGTQYIDTGLIGTDLTDKEIELTIKNNTTGLNKYNFNGAYQVEKSTQMGTVATSNTTCRCSINFGFTDAVGVDSLDITRFHKLYAKDGLQKANNVQIGTKSFGSLNEYSFLLFARTNVGGTITNIEPNAGSSISLFTVKKNGKYIRYLVPCYRNSDNVVGMYDLVSDTFFTNAGKGTFNVGAVVSKTSVGDLVTDTSDINYGKYKIPVLTNSHTTNIYLNKPLRRVSKLPYGYTELEHIRSTGTQYIDIGRKMYNNSEIELCFSFDEMQENCSIFGSRTSSTTNNFEIASQNPNFPIYLDFGHFNTSRATYNNAVINTKYVCTISKSLRAVYDENRTLLVRNTALISADNATPSNARIFDTAGGYSANKLKGKVYYCKIWENGVLIRDMIPCKNPSNVVGMYDTVNNVFYSNAGSGSFIAGAEVQTVYYTDYLDYENQKVVRNVDDNDKGLDTPVEESVVLPAVPTDEGTVTVDVDTEIAPSYAEVVYYKNDV